MSPRRHFYTSPAFLGPLLAGQVRACSAQQRTTPGKEAELTRILTAIDRAGRAARLLARYPVAAALALVAALASPLRAGVELPVGNQTGAISIRAGGATHWKQGAYEVWVLGGDVQITQGDVVAKSREAVLWIDRAEAFSGRPSKIIAYLEKFVQVDFGRGGDPHAITGRRAQSLVDEQSWIGRFHTTGGIELAAPLTSHEPQVRPAIFARGNSARENEFKPAPQAAAAELPYAVAPSQAVQPAQFTREEIAPPAGTPVAPAGNRVVIEGRGSRGFSPHYFTDAERNERIVVSTTGVIVRIDGIDQLGSVRIDCDRVVTWVPNVAPGSPAFNQAIQSGEGPLEFYLEGNIVFRQGDRVIYADRMYYNVIQQQGVVLNAEMLTPVPQYRGYLRLKADVLRQVNRQRFEAYNAGLTSSRMGIPRYWFQSQNVAVDDVQTPIVDPFTGLPLLTPDGEPQVDHQLLATARNNTIHLAGVPIFYWPTIATDLTEPTYYLTGFRFRNDSVFGTGAQLDWDLYQLLGIEDKPPNTKWTLSTDYFNLRGPALGTNFGYQGNTLFGVSGPYRGFFDAWGIHDDGTDNLGREWRDLAIPNDIRGRVLARHRQYLPNDFILSAELGLISDYNFLEQYYELEWDTFKDQSTGVELKKLLGNSSLAISGDVRPDGFVTDTEWLPRADHYLFGQPLLFDRLTWHAHSSVGYAHMREASPPVDPAQVAVISPLAWEADVQGLRAATRHELDLPLELGPAKVVPYILGEAAYWGEDLNGQSLTRGYAQAGVKASVPIWRADPTVGSELFNLTGLAHKITLEAEYFFADASQDLADLPLYDPLDDNATEFTRRQMAVRTFGQAQGTFVPLQFDERFFALRSNLQGSVSSPVEIADDLTALRLGINQRWQTKRGLPGQQRIIDWIVFDLQAVLFPDEAQNFGSAIGLVDYEFRWHVGDRLTLLSDGYYDGYDQGLRQATVGALISRPEYGNVYLGFRSTEGPISSNIATGSLSYRMSEKWIATAGAMWDFGSTGNIGQNFALTRIGESFLIRLGFNFDASRNNIGATFGIEPRFLPNARLGRVGGVQIPPAGALGLE